MKLIFAVIVGVVACEAFSVSELTPRIVGGEDAKLGEIPYIISLRGLDMHGCGAAIISKNMFVTAAHCAYKNKDRPDVFSVQYGVVDISETGPTVLQVKRFFIHEGYMQSGNYPHDIALGEVIGEFVFGPNAQPIALPTPFEVPSDFTDAVLAGWGLNYTGGKIMTHLQKVVITIYSPEICLKIESGLDTASQFCAGLLAGGKGQCKGDSGGPLAVDGKLYGIVSWSRKPCASKYHPGIYTSVAAHRNWIRKNSGV